MSASSPSSPARQASASHTSIPRPSGPVAQLTRTGVAVVTAAVALVGSMPAASASPALGRA